MRILMTLTLILVTASLVHSPLAAQESESSSDAGAKETKKLFNGKDLEGWKVLDKFVFKRHGKVVVNEGEIQLGKGSAGTGIVFEGKPPRVNYELRLQAKRTEGSDFFCGITFPVNDDYCTLILGGWGGGATGLSNLDDLSAVENNTSDFVEFENNKWYPVRLRVTEEKIEAWVGEKQIVDVEHQEHKLSIWWEQEPARPLGIATWYTSASLKEIELERLEKGAGEEGINAEIAKYAKGRKDNKR